MNCYLGIDVGTTGTKSILFTEYGQVVTAAYKSYALVSENRFYAEQNAEDWYNALIFTCRECCKGLSKADNVLALSISAQGGCLLCVDEEYKPLSPAISWLDKRMLENADYFNDILKNVDIYKISGWQQIYAMTAMQILYLKHFNKELYSTTHKFLSAVDYINYKLTGIAAIDPSNAAMTQLYNIENNNYDRNMLDLLGISEERLAKVICSGGFVGMLQKDVADQIGINSDCKVISGGHDQYCGSLGCGAVNDNDVMVATGTTWLFLVTTNNLVFTNDKKYLSPGNHIIPKHGIMASITTGGVCLEWFKEKVVKSEDASFLKTLDKGAKNVPAGANGVCFYPYFGGSYCPDYRHENRAAFLGMDLSADQNVLGRAIMEGVCFELLRMLETIKLNNFSPARILAVGGATKSELWMEILASVLNCKVLTPAVPDTPCVGAAILAAGKSEGFVKYLKVFEPSSDYSQFYSKYCKTFDKIF